jgi:hypothetical protein
MAKRQETTDIFGGKLSGIGTFGSTEQQQPASKAGRYYRKTYLLTEEIIERVKETANQYQVGHSEFVRWALTTILDEVEAGEREIPVTVEEKRVISG